MVAQFLSHSTVLFYKLLLITIVESAQPRVEEQNAAYSVQMSLDLQICLLHIMH